MSSLLINGICYAEASTALSAFQSKFPTFTGDKANYLATSSIDMSTGIVDYSLNDERNVSVATGLQVKYPTCPDGSIPDFSPTFFIILFAVTLVAGFAIGYFVTQSGK
jgi:hypothetical protein